jgi:UDP-glucose 4-epimerase
VFGRRQKKGVTGAVIPRFVEQALTGHPLTLYGNGEQTREYTYVSDIVEAYAALAERDDLAGEAFNIGSGDTPTMRSIVDFIAGELGGTVEQQPGRVGEISRVALDSTKIRALGVTTKIEFWDGLRQYIEWRKLIG